MGDAFGRKGPHAACVIEVRVGRHEIADRLVRNDSPGFRHDGVRAPIVAQGLDDDEGGR